MSFHSFDLQKAIYSRLDGNIADTSVYDDVPEGSSYPYVVIGEDTFSDVSTKTLRGAEYTLTLHVWSQYRGRKEVKEIMEGVHTLLHNVDLSVDNASLVNLKQEFSTTLLENDGITRHGIMRFRAVVFDSI